MSAQNKKPDWKYWLKLKEVKVFEALALLDDVEPEEAPPDLDDTSPAYRKRQRLLLSALSDRQQFSPGILNMGNPTLHEVRLIEVGAWALKNGINLPEKFPHSIFVSKAPSPITPVKGRGASHTYANNSSQLPPIDWKYWRHMPSVEQWQACALSLNVNPDNMEIHPQSWMSGPGESIPSFKSQSFPTPSIELEFYKRCRLLMSHAPSPQYFTTQHLNTGVLIPIRLSEFAVWALSVEFDEMPPELKALAKPSTQGMEFKSVYPPERNYIHLNLAAKFLVSKKYRPENESFNNLELARLIRQGVIQEIPTNPLKYLRLKEIPIAQKNIDQLLKLGKLHLYETPGGIRTNVIEGAYINEAQFLELLMSGAHLELNQEKEKKNLEQESKPWLVKDPNDPTPEQTWYTPARYFARQLVAETPTLINNKRNLAVKVSHSLSNVGIKKRGGKKPFDPTTILKAFSNVELG